jgi:hypothetical protein
LQVGISRIGAFGDPEFAPLQYSVYEQRSGTGGRLHATGAPPWVRLP